MRELWGDCVKSLHGNFVLNVSDNSVKGKPICDTSIGGISVKRFTDSVSPYTIISEDIWKEKFVKKIGHQLYTTDVNPEVSQVRKSTCWV